VVGMYSIDPSSYPGPTRYSDARDKWPGLNPLHVIPYNVVTAEQFIGAMPKLLASKSRVAILPVELPVRPWPFAIFTLKDRTLSPAVDRFIAHLRDFARSM